MSDPEARARARTRFQELNRFVDFGASAAGLSPAAVAVGMMEPELHLYRLLRGQSGDAYSRYNALMRELVSFESALDHRRRQVAG